MIYKEKVPKFNLFYFTISKEMREKWAMNACYFTFEME